ncbi:MAG: protein kinase domain-containing protein [Gemmatimonadales bacterium]
MNGPPPADLRERLQSSLGSAYAITRELGGGGMSRVFVAEETALGRTVVVKVIAPELTEGLSAERFTREVKLAARLQQANIVPLLDAGDAGGVPYFTMPFVDGLSLRSRLSTGVPLGQVEAIHILRDVAKALAYAHAQGVVHRDIKPENVLLSGGTAMVTDFGIAKAITAARTRDGNTDAGAISSATLTSAGSSLGTPAYMAPEQAVGSAVDSRADLYAWGVMAYELLTGAHPFAGRTTTQQLVAAHIAETPAPIASKLATIPGALADAVMQCLAKDPSHRPGTATEVLQYRQALAAADRAVALDPSSASAQSRRGMTLMGLGRLSEAEGPLRTAVSLDPLVGAYTTRLVWIDVAKGHADSAVHRVARVKATDPANTTFLYLLAGSILQIGLVREAVEACSAQPGAEAACRSTLPLLVDPARRSDAVALLDAWVQPGALTLLALHGFRAAAYAHLGETDKAFATLRQSFSADREYLMWAYINSPWLVPLKSDPRWQSIVVAGQNR